MQTLQGGLQPVLFSGESFASNGLLLTNRTEEAGYGGFAGGDVPGTWWHLVWSWWLAPQPSATTPWSLLFWVRLKEVQSHTKQIAFSEIYLRIIEAMLSYLLIHTCPY